MIKVLANGCFDALHVGHLWHLEAAKKLGDELWVSITDDLHVNKGPGRPIYPQEHRAALVKALKCVDKVITVGGLMEALEFVKPSILVKGTDYRNGLAEYHESYCKKHGIRIAFTDTEKLSAADFINDSIRRSQV